MKKLIIVILILSNIPVYSQKTRSLNNVRDSVFFANWIKKQWSTQGNANTSNNDFIGTTNPNSLIFKVNNSNVGILDYNTNVGFGKNVLQNNTSGYGNTGLGFDALKFNTIGSYNTAIGANAQIANSNLFNATAIGANAYAVQSNTIVLGSINNVNYSGGNTLVGIGTNTPTTNLDIMGGLRLRDGTEGINKYLGTDNTGNASWKLIPPSIISTGTINYLPKFSTNNTSISNSKIFDNGVNVGIGTNDPSKKIHLKETSLFLDGDSILFKTPTLGFVAPNFAQLGIGIYNNLNQQIEGSVISYRNDFSNNVDNNDVRFSASNWLIKTKFLYSNNQPILLSVERKNLNLYPDTIIFKSQNFGQQLKIKIYPYPSFKKINAYFKDNFLNDSVFISNVDTTFYTYNASSNPLSNGERFQIIHTSENLEYPKVFLNPELKKNEISEILALQGGELKKIKLLDKMTTTQRLALTGASLYEGKEVYDTDLHIRYYFNGTVWVD